MVFFSEEESTLVFATISVNKMNTKKTSLILKSLKPRASKKSTQTRSRSKIKPNSTFWGKIFMLKGLAPEDLNYHYTQLIMDLQDELKQACDRLEKNKTSLAEVAKYNKVKAQLIKKLKIIRTLRFSFSFADHQRFLSQQDLAFVPKIPIESIKKFLAQRTAVPSSAPSRSLIGSFTDRIIAREHVKKAKLKVIDAAGLAIQPQTPVTTPKFSQEPIHENYLDQATVPWFPHARHLMVQEDLTEQGHLLYQHGVLVPRLLALKQDGKWWVRVKKPWLKHVMIYSRPFIPGKVGYLLKNNTLHVESEEDYSKFISWRENLNAPNKNLPVENLFSGLSNEFVQSILKEVTSIDRLIWFMATLDFSVSNNQTHRMRFYSEHYKAKIVKLTPKEIFPEIFYNTTLSHDQVQIVKTQITIAKNRINHFLQTGKMLKTSFHVPVKLPILDISANPNAFWYINTAGNLATGDILNPPTDIHSFSKAYVACLLPVQSTDTEGEMDVEEFFEGVKKPKLLAPNLFFELNKELDLILGRFYDRNIQVVIPQILSVTKDKLLRYYHTTLNE